MPRRLKWRGRQFLLYPVLGHFRTACLSKDNGPDMVKHYYAILIHGHRGRWWTPDSLTSVRYGASGAPKKAGPRPNSPPRPAERPGAGRVILWFPAPAPGPARSPDRSPLKQVGRNGAPSKECAGTRPGRWRGGDHPQNNPPGPL